MDLSSVSSKELEAELFRRRKILNQASVYDLMNELVERHTDNEKIYIGPKAALTYSISEGFQQDVTETICGPTYILVVYAEPKS